MEELRLRILKSNKIKAVANVLIKIAQKKICLGGGKADNTISI